jgi:hypothetical protein
MKIILVRGDYIATRNCPLAWALKRVNKLQDRTYITLIAAKPQKNVAIQPSRMHKCMIAAERLAG